MPRFDAELNREQADAIHAYIIEQAHEDLQAREGNFVWRSIKQGLYSTLAWVLFRAAGSCQRRSEPPKSYVRFEINRAL